MPDRSLREEELLSRLGWFIRVRWLFLIGLVCAIAATYHLFRNELPVAKTVLVGATILAYNTCFAFYHRFLRKRSAPSLARSRAEAIVQIGLDLLALTFLVHFNGAAENPFIFFYLFHVILGSMLLSRTEAWLVAFGAATSFIGLLALEYFAVIPHYQARWLSAVARHQDLLFLGVVSVTFLITLFTTLYMTSSIVSSLRGRELQLVVTQKALVKKSDDLETAHRELKEKQKQLLQSEKQAGLGQLVAGIAHEINNPIQFIKGNMAILKEALDDVLPILDQRASEAPGLAIARLDYAFFREHIPVLVKDMGEGAARIGDIVRDLKTFARKDEGRLTEEVDLNLVVQASRRLLRNEVKHYQVVEDLAQDLPTVQGSTNQLQQVVVNTLLNAAQALAQARVSSPTITLASRADPATQRVRLSVSDNGPGMPVEIKDRIFDPFFTTKQRTGGTGLGLSITYGIIEQHGGTIEVESEAGRGTTFTYWLPAARNGA